MFDEIKRNLASIKLLVTLIIIATAIFVFGTIWQTLSQFSDIFIMLICAWLISFILEPIVERLMHFTKIPKVMSALIIYLLFFGMTGAIIFLFIPVFTNQIQNLLIILPGFLSSYPAFVNKWGELLSSSLSTSISLLPSVANFLFSFFIILIISFYFVLDKEKINQEFYSILPKKWHKDAAYVQEVIDSTFSSFLLVQLWFGIISGIFTWIVLTLFGVNYAATTSVFAGILTMVPLIGAILGIIPPIIVSLVTDSNKTIFVTIILLILQQIEFNIIGPKLIGKAFKLHPVIVLLSFLVGYKIAGGAGAIFAVPVLGVLVVVAHRLSSHFMQNFGK